MTDTVIEHYGDVEIRQQEDGRYAATVAGRALTARRVENLRLLIDTWRRYWAWMPPGAPPGARGKDA